MAPTWLSAETDLYGTGLDLGDIDGDGWLDLAVSNGNDIVAAPNLAYLNQGGTLPSAASWVSDDARFSGHCELADLDGDGLPELVVGNYITEGWGPAQVQVHRNLGGALEGTPSWESSADLHSFRVSLGDPDGDGDLDLAVATGEAYNALLEPNLVFFNEGGTLAPAPGWTSEVADACYDVAFVDHDGDGDQDLAFLGGGWLGRVTIYENQDGVLATTPTWTTDGLDNGNTFDWDDLDGDGRLDLAVGYNQQLGGSGRFAVYLTAGGALPQAPTWTSEFRGYGSAVACADMDGAGGADLIAGGWWEPLRIYLNDGSGGFAAEPDWQSDAGWSSVAEAIRLADLDEAATREMTATYPAGSRLLPLPDRHLQGIDGVTIAGQPLGRDRWCGSLRGGWVSLDAPASGVTVVRYRVSSARDLVLSNWDQATFVFENMVPTAAPDVGPDASPGALPGAPLVADLSAWPNPFNPRTTVGFRLMADASHARLRIHDLRGRQVATLHDGPLTAGHHRLPWQPRDLASGVYIYRLEADGATRSGKLVLVR